MGQRILHRLVPDCLRAQRSLNEANTTAFSLALHRVWPANRPMSPPSRIDLLTSAEMEVLRLVLRTQKTDEIAYLLGRSPHTVNAHLRSARAKLGVSSKLAAAKLLEAQENPSQSLTSQPLTMFTVADIRPSASTLTGDADQDTNPRSTSQIAGDENERDAATLIDARHVLSVLAKIVVIAVGLAILALSLPLLSEGAQRLADRLFR